MESEYAASREAERIRAEDVVAAGVVGHGAEPVFLLHEGRRVERMLSADDRVGEGVRVIDDGKRAIVPAVQDVVDGGAVFQRHVDGGGFAVCLVAA